MRAMVRVQWRPWIYLESEPIMEAYLLSIRDDFRAQLDGDNLHTNWLVSDIIRWEGNTPGYAFVVFHMDGGVKTGPSWLFFLPGRNTAGTSPGEIRRIAGNFSDPVLSSYFRSSSLSTSSIGNQGSIAFHYNPTGGTSSPYNGGWDVDGELSGGDFTLPSVNPYTNLDDFMPSTSELLGYVTATNGTFLNAWVAIFDSDVPFAGIYVQWGLMNLVNMFCVAGKIVVPYEDSDTLTDGVIQGYMAFSTTTTLSTFGGVEIWAYNAQGQVTRYTPDYHLLWDANTAVLSNGEYAWDVIAVESTNHFKGYLHTDVFRNMGLTNREGLKLFDDGKFIKYHYSVCFPYVQGEPVFPGG